MIVQYPLRPEVDEITPRRLRALVVDDDHGAREALAQVLKSTFDVEAVGSGQEALSRLRSAPASEGQLGCAWNVEPGRDEFGAAVECGMPHVIVSDCNMPGMSGLDLLKEVRADERMSSLPFILVSARGEADIVVAGLELGANDFVTKPISPPVLLARMGTHVRAAELQARLQHQNALLARLAAFDDLTGVYNRRSLNDALEAETVRCSRYGHPLAVMMLDIDHFKRVNDAHGHLAGDEILKGLVARVGPTLRSTDVFCRYGGEEFCVLMPETAPAAALAAAERIRALVGDKPFPAPPADDPIPVTVSLGLACLPVGFHSSPTKLLVRADEALYQAKRQGRNRVSTYTPDACMGDDEEEF